MIYVVAFSLLVAVVAWLVSFYHRLNFLRGQVQEAWLQWSRVTTQRNERMGSFADAFSAKLPADAMLPRDLRRLAEDSKLALSARPSAPRPGGFKGLRETELGLRQRMGDSMSVIENSQTLRDNVDLVQECRDVAASLALQEKIAKAYDRSAGDYNNALVGPCARVVAGIFGFMPVAQMYRYSLHQNVGEESLPKE